MLTLLFTHIAHPLPASDFQFYLNQLPNTLHPHIVRHTRWQDKHASLFGKLLLQIGLSSYEGYPFTLHDLQYTAYQRPFITGSLDFNISHSGALVICAFSTEYRVGIDIEEIKPVSLPHFRTQWTNREWENIIGAPHPYGQFYHYWTRKEALLKAIGKGILRSLHQIEVINDSTFFEGNRWYLRTLFIADNYVAHLATDCEISCDIRVERVDFP